MPGRPNTGPAPAAAAALLGAGPARGGTRGGKDQFSWDNVKTSVDREYYLGG